MRVVNPSEERQPKRIALYGDPKVGKSRLATSLPWGEEWGSKAVYVAWDAGASDLGPVELEDRGHLVVVKPYEGGSQDPLEEATKIATFDWKKAYPEAGTIIWDTMTTTSADLLSAISELGLYGKNIAYGKKGTDAYVPQPQPGDYGSAQRSTAHILKMLFNQPLNVLVLFHAIMTDPQDGEVVGGPATVGKASIRPVAGMFDNLFRVAHKKTRVPNSMPPAYTSKRVVQTEGEGSWLAGARSPHAQNPIAEVELKDGRNFWLTFTETMKGNK